VRNLPGQGHRRACGKPGAIHWPFAYAQVYCGASVDDDLSLVVDVMMAVGGRMSGTPLGEEARPFVEAMAKKEDRVVVRCRPYETFAQPPRHLDENDQEQEITHWITARMPWNASDEGSA